jgi:DNA invertase Pin-like site-specific DNA recombinase
MRAGIYYRVSSEEQVDGFSLDAQRRILTDFCQAKGWPIAGEYADEGKSARGDNIAKRPQFKRLMEDAEDGRLDVVVVHKIDRFARNIRVTFEYLEHLARHNVSFVAVAQPDLDYTRSDGRFFMGMMATLAQYYSDNLSQETKKGKAERKAQGLYNGHLPFGMMKGSDGIPVENPDTIDGLRLAFALAAEGESDRSVARALNEGGYRTTGVWLGMAAPFTKDTVARMLQNRFYLGELPGERPADATPARHGAVIDRGLFEAAQQGRERRATSRGVSVAPGMNIYSLSGLGTCAACGGRLQIQPGKGSPRLYCSSRRQGTGCHLPAHFHHPHRLSRAPVPVRAGRVKAGRWRDGGAAGQPGAAPRALQGPLPPGGYRARGISGRARAAATRPRRSRRRAIRRERPTGGRGRLPRRHRAGVGAGDPGAA